MPTLRFVWLPSPEAQRVPAMSNKPLLARGEVLGHLAYLLGSEEPQGAGAQVVEHAVDPVELRGGHGTWVPALEEEQAWRP